MQKLANKTSNPATNESSESTSELLQILANIEELVPPLWSIGDYVAVNPWVGFTSNRFLDTQQTLRDVRDCDMLMSREYYDSLLQSGRLSVDDIKAALIQTASEYPDFYANFDDASVMKGQSVAGKENAPKAGRYRTVASLIDEQQESNWSSNVINDISRHLAGHYDQGQALWPSPWVKQPLFTAWREASRVSRRMDWLGLRGFRIVVSGLSPRPEEAILAMLNELNVPRHCWRPFLLCELYSITGWASYVNQQVRESRHAGLRNDDLIGLIAIRLVYDVALARNFPKPSLLPMIAAETRILEGSPSAPEPSHGILSRYVLQVATERAYRRQLCRQISQNRDLTTSTLRKRLQIVFCIDVRSEVFRRHLESVDDSIETFGFAGFFGMALQYVRLGATRGSDQCPVLLQPAFRIQETVLGADESRRARALDLCHQNNNWRLMWRSFQASAASCFTFVESLGLTFAVTLLLNCMPWAKRPSLPDQDVESVGPEIAASGSAGLSVDQQLDLAQGMLKNLGLTDRFARLVVFCGHEAHVTNNPYKASLDCGACGGHSGEPNARVAAMLLNNPEVRNGLLRRGVAIPSDTCFLAAVHDTVTDQIRVCDASTIPATHSADHAALTDWTHEAGGLARQERSKRFANTVQKDLLRRAHDWSEVRPEWGLAGNAALIVARRERTIGLNLRGRTFLHSYDHTRDVDLKILTLIMTAPMIVANWINLQYYASTVDRRAFGSGNKALHNVVGQFGVFEGNAGDLMTGLPWQSVFDGRQFQHEPLRLLVVIEATCHAIQTVILQHSLVKDLATNGWLSIVALDQEKFYRWTSEGTWEYEPVISDEHLARIRIPCRHETDHAEFAC